MAGKAHGGWLSGVLRFGFAWAGGMRGNEAEEVPNYLKSQTNSICPLSPRQARNPSFPLPTVISASPPSFPRRRESMLPQPRRCRPFRHTLPSSFPRRRESTAAPLAQSNQFYAQAMPARACENRSRCAVQVVCGFACA